MFFQNPPIKAGCLLLPPPFRFPQSATPTALRQGKKHPLTVLVSVAFAHQRNGSGESRLTVGVSILTHLNLLSMPISNCRHAHL